MSQFYDLFTLENTNYIKIAFYKNFIESLDYPSSWLIQ